MEASLGGLLAAPSEEVSAAEATEAQRTRRKRIRFSISSQAIDPRFRLEAQTALIRQAKLKLLQAFYFVIFASAFFWKNLRSGTRTAIEK